MKVHSIIIAMPVSEIDASRGFYEDFQGLGNEEFNLGWWSVLPRRRREPMFNSSPTECGGPVLSLKVDDFEAACSGCRRTVSTSSLRWPQRTDA